MRFWVVRVVRVALLSAASALMSVSIAVAQTPPTSAAASTTSTTTITKKDNRIPIAAADLRGVSASLGQDATTAASLFVTATDLPGRAFGLVSGAHVYPLRGRSVALGLGGEILMAGKSFEPLNAETKKPGGRVYSRRLRAYTAQVSANFGHRMGWSYLTVGFGPTSFDSYLSRLEPDGLRPATLNYGGGARWFNFEHLAFNIDLRFYATKPALATANTAARERHRVLVMSAGISIK